MRSDNILASWIGSGFATIFSAIQENPIFQLISFILTALSVIISLAYTIYKWVKRAKADGKITSDEVEELFEIVGEHGDKLTKRKDK